MCVCVCVCVCVFVCVCALCFLPPQFNGVSMKNKTVEEAYLELLKPGEAVTFKVQHLTEDLTLIKEFPGDGFFIRYDETLPGSADPLKASAPSTPDPINNRVLITAACG